MRTFERRFAGKNNAGLRAKIRETVSGHRCGPANGQAVRSLARVVALTASGKATLEAVAEDYSAVAVDGKTSCDCARCYAGNLQALGANG